VRPGRRYAGALRRLPHKRHPVPRARRERRAARRQGRVLLLRLFAGNGFAQRAPDRHRGHARRGDAGRGHGAARGTDQRAEHSMKARSGGFTLVSVIFLLVVVAALGAFMVTIGTTQRETSALSLLSGRAPAAAEAGQGWAGRRGRPGGGRLA